MAHERYWKRCDSMILTENDILFTPQTKHN